MTRRSPMRSWINFCDEGTVLIFPKCLDVAPRQRGARRNSQNRSASAPIINYEGCGSTMTQNDVS